MQAYMTSFSVSFKFKIYVHIESKDISDAVLKVGAYMCLKIFADGKIATSTTKCH